MTDSKQPAKSATPQPDPVTFTVLIPNYNHAQYLPISIESVVSQSRQPEAIYVLDDCSKDNSVEVARGYSARYPNVHVVAREKNLTAVRNINEFIPKVKTTFTFFLGADDYMLPGFIENAYNALSKHPSAGICTSETISLMMDGTKKHNRLAWAPETTWLSPQQLARAARDTCTGLCFYNTEALQKINGFPEELRWHSDHFAGWVLAAQHGACYLTTPGMVFRMSETGHCAAGSKSKEHRNVMLKSFDYLKRPEFADIKPILRDAHVLSIFDQGLFAEIRKPENRYFLTRSFMAMLVKRQLKLRFRHPVPEPMKWWLRGLFKSKPTATGPAPHA